MLTEEDPRKWHIEAEQQLRIRADAWAYLVEQGKVDQYFGGEITFNDLRREIRALHRAFGPPAPVVGEGQQGEAPPLLSESSPTAGKYSLREEALSRVVADYVAQDGDVQAFRAEHLGGNLLDWPRAVEWLQRQFQAAFASSSDSSVALPPWYEDAVAIPAQYTGLVDALVRHHDHNAPTVVDDVGNEIPVTLPLSEVPQRFRDGCLRRLLLYYIRPEDPEIRAFPVWPGTPLERLRAIASRLHRSISSWHEAPACIFVLTGEVPLITNVSFEMQTSETVPGLSQIVLRVDPSLSPRELADLYREIRRYAVGERHRELSPKHAALALFSVTELRHEPLAARMAAWNRQHPEWPYTRESTFSWDMLQAQRRTLGIVVSSARGARSEKKRQARGEEQEG